LHAQLFISSKILCTHSLNIQLLLNENSVAQKIIIIEGEAFDIWTVTVIRNIALKGNQAG